MTKRGRVIKRRDNKEKERDQWRQQRERLVTTKGEREKWVTTEKERWVTAEENVSQQRKINGKKTSIFSYEFNKANLECSL